MSYSVLISLQANSLQYEALFSKRSWQVAFESSHERARLLQPLSPFPNRLDTVIGRTCLCCSWVGLFPFHWGLLAILNTGYVLLFSGAFVVASLSFSQTLTPRRSWGYWLFMPIHLYCSIYGNILLPISMVWMCSLEVKCWKFVLQGPILIKIGIRAFGGN